MKTKNTTENIVFELENKQVIQQGSEFFTRIFENGEILESGDFNTLEKAKENLGIKPTIEENNIMLTEFLGIEYIKEIKTFQDVKNQNWFEETPKFNTDWNWLMQVVEKIESIKSDNVYTLSIENKFCQILENGTFLNEIISIEGDTKIDAVYNACVYFVNWYNEENN